jgi:hypothetical protein
MRKAEIEIGGTYVAKVSGKLTTVRIINESQHGGWNAINTATNHEVRIRGAARLRKKVEPLAFYWDRQGERRELPRAEAVALAHESFGVGTWLDGLRQARTAEGLKLNDGAILRARTTGVK